MGLERSAVVAPPATGILDPRTGRPVGADDSFFVGLNNTCFNRYKGCLTPVLCQAWIFGLVGTQMMLILRISAGYLFRYYL